MHGNLATSSSLYSQNVDFIQTSGFANQSGTTGNCLIIAFTVIRRI